MFDFNEDKLTDDQVMEVARQDNLPPLRVAINANGYRASGKYWSKPVCEMSERDLKVARCVVKLARNGKGVVGSRSLYESVRKLSIFSSTTGVMCLLTDDILPNLDMDGITCLIGDKIYVNPLVIGDDNWPAGIKVIKPQNPTIHGYDSDEVEKAVRFYRKAKALLNGE